jgi:hypothetical protein
MSRILYKYNQTELGDEINPHLMEIDGDAKY